METEQKKGFFENNRRIIIVIFVVFAIIFGIMIYRMIFKSTKTFTIVNGYVEKVSDTFAYLVKKETIMDMNKSDTTVPIVEQYKRVAKNQVIATYKNSKYEEYLKQIDAMDKEIQTIVKDLPTTYSNDVSDIDNEITKVTEEAKKATSYVKMQEYKSKLDELSNKKVTMLSELSPKGSKIRELIDNRKKLEEQSASSSDNIRSTASGIMTYKIDELENVINIDNLLTSTPEQLDAMMEKYKNNTKNIYGMKIVDNFKAYLVVKEPLGENDTYIKEGRVYNIRVTDKDNLSLTATLIKDTKTAEFHYAIFEIDNDMESLVDARAMNVEVIWTKVTGMTVPNTALKKDENTTYDYITVIKGGDYVDVPVSVKIASDSICVIENLTEAKRKELNIANTNTFSLYDQVLIYDQD